ncbi:primosomal protein [Actinokineospora sp. 24-640]
MAQDIVPIELGLPQGDLVTLWAPRWREGGEEWEAFLGHEEDLYAFPDPAHLAAFVRTAEDHDLIDHPAWNHVPALTVAELMPAEAHQYDLVGVPELVAEEPDTWTIGELAEIVSIVRSLADVCELDEVHEILDSADGFAVLDQGTYPFTGREGERLWNDLAKTVVDKWDDLLDALDSVVTVPEVTGPELDKAAGELAVLQAEAEAAAAKEDDDEEGDAETTDEEAEAADDAPVGFWAEVGIDPIKIISDGSEYYTLRCYLDDKPIFLGSEGRIDVTTSANKLAKYLAVGDFADNDLAEVSTWDEVAAKATDGSLDVTVDEDNTYVLQGLAEDLAEGMDAVDPVQLDLAVELLSDAAEWAEDDSVATALNQSESLGWLVSFILAPDPTRLAPSPPFDAESAAWAKLVQNFEDRLQTR